MKLSDIKENLDSGVDIEKLDIELNNYISIAIKEVLVNGIDMDNEKIGGLVDICTSITKDGILEVDHLIKNIRLTLTTLPYYSNIEIDEENNTEFSNIEVYDYIMKSGIYDYVLGRNIDFIRLKEMLDTAIEEKRYKVQQSNSIENQLFRFLNNINENLSEKKMISFLKKAKKEFAGVKIEDFPILKDLAKTYGNIELPNIDDISKNIDTVMDTIKEKK